MKYARPHIGKLPQLNGIIMAHYLKYTFVDPAEVIFFDEDGEFDADKTNAVLR